MQAFPRAMIALAMLAVAFVPVPTAIADDCVELNTATFDIQEGLRLIANTGRQLTFGIRSGDPGDGLALILIVTPGVCSGFGLTPGGLDFDPEELQNNAPLLPLP